MPLCDEEPPAKHIEVIETILVDEEDEDDKDGDADVRAERDDHDQQEQPVG